MFRQSSFILFDITDPLSLIGVKSGSKMPSVEVPAPKYNNQMICLLVPGVYSIRSKQTTPDQVLTGARYCVQTRRHCL